MRPLVFAVSGGVLLSAAFAQAADLATGLVGYWKLDEAAIAAGTAAIDSSPTGANGAYVNAPTTDTAVPSVGYADPRSVMFSKAMMQAVQVAGAPAALRPAAVTLAGWFKLGAALNGSAYGELVSVGDQTLLRVYGAQVTTAKSVAGGWVQLNAAAMPSDGKWHHLAATIDAAAVTIYFDGAPLGTMADTQPILYDLGPDVWIGRHGSGTMGRDFDGNVDEVAIWSRALTPAQVAALAAGSQPGSNPAPPADASVADAAADASGDADADADVNADAAADAVVTTSDATTDRAPRADAGRPPPPSGTGCGCASTPPPRSPDGALAILLGLLAALVARRGARS
jgi:MYXO-CTERM domain-containing protein